MTRIMTSVGVFAAPGMAMAHPQHAVSESYGLVHLVTDPFHVSMSLAAVASFLLLRRLMLRRRAASRLRQS